MKQYFVYIITIKKYGVLYTGVTNNLERRSYEHKNKIFSGFTKKYNLTKIVYCDSFLNIIEAITAEKQIKGWLRIKKIMLIESVNPQWNDLSL